MRKIVALGCGVLCLTFGSVAGAAHVHEGAGRNAGTPGLHLDHIHVGEGRDHGPHAHHRSTRSRSDESRVERRRMDHQGKGAVYLRVSSYRLVDYGIHLTFATVATKTTIDPPPALALGRTERSDPLRGPPGTSPIPPRAPPA